MKGVLRRTVGSDNILGSSHLQSQVMVGKSKECSDALSPTCSNGGQDYSLHNSVGFGSIYLLDSSIHPGLDPGLYSDW